MTGAEPNDPSLDARAVIQAVEADDPPLRLPLGIEVLAAIREKLQAHSRELDP